MLPKFGQRGTISPQSRKWEPASLFFSTVCSGKQYCDRMQPFSPQREHKTYLRRPWNVSSLRLCPLALYSVSDSLFDPVESLSLFCKLVLAIGCAIVIISSQALFRGRMTVLPIIISRVYYTPFLFPYYLCVFLSGYSLPSRLSRCYLSVLLRCRKLVVPTKPDFSRANLILRNLVASQVFGNYFMSWWSLTPFSFHCSRPLFLLAGFSLFFFSKSGMRAFHTPRAYLQACMSRFGGAASAIASECQLLPVSC